MENKPKLFFVQVDNEFSILALNVSIKQEGNEYVLTFFDTNRGRMFKGKISETNEDGFVFNTENNQNMVFKVANIKEFNKNWRSQVEGKVPDFQDDNELHQWYAENFS